LSRRLQTTSEETGKELNHKRHQKKLLRGTALGTGGKDFRYRGRRENSRKEKGGPKGGKAPAVPDTQGPPNLVRGAVEGADNLKRVA